MQLPTVIGSAALLAVAGWLYLAPADSPSTPANPRSNPLATPRYDQGHLVLVVEGDRNALTITHASHKTDPWAGVPKGLTSDFELAIRDRQGDVLLTIPLDVSHFATGAADVGQPVRVEGCVVRDSRIAMLVNVPVVPGAASYAFRRREADATQVSVGAVDGRRVDDLARGGR